MEEILASIRRIIADDASGLAQRVHQGLSAPGGAQHRDSPEPAADPDMDALFATHASDRADSEEDMYDLNAAPSPRVRDRERENEGQSAQIRPRLVDVSAGDLAFPDLDRSQRSSPFDLSADEPAPAAYRSRDERPDRSERADRSERPERPERSERPERPERSERMERPERSERNEPVPAPPAPEQQQPQQPQAQAPEQKQPQPQQPQQPSPPQQPGRGQQASQAQGVIDERLLSPTVGAAVSGAFANLNSLVLSGQPRTLEDLMAEIIRPLLKTWLDQNLPILVERLVREEIERVSHSRRR